MAISLLSAATRIRDQITERGEAVAGFSIENIIGQIPTISERFASSLMNDPKRREYLRPLNPFSATVVAGMVGIADLSTLVETSRMMLDRLDAAELRLSPDTNGYPFAYFQEVSQLDQTRPTDLMYIGFAMEGEKLYFKNTDGDRAADLGDITIAGFQVPLIADAAADSTLSRRLESDFITFSTGEVIKWLAPKKGSR